MNKPAPARFSERSFRTLFIKRQTIPTGTLVALVLMLSPWCDSVYSQPSHDAPVSDTLPFRSLEILEKKRKFLQIEKRIEAERKRERDLRRQMGAIVEKMHNGDHQEQLDDRVLAYMPLSDEIAALLKGHGENMRRLTEIAALLRDAGKLETLEKEDSSELKKRADALSKVWRYQSDIKKRLAELQRLIKWKIRNVPPPPEFLNEREIRMILVGQGKNAFYVSSEPLSRKKVLEQKNGSREESPEEEPDDADLPGNDRITWIAAMRFCKRLSGLSRQTYRLPSIEQLGRISLPEDMAFWSRTKWEPDSPSGKQAHQQFKIVMLSIWDPSHILGDSDVIGEVTFASYPHLGIVVVTDADAGRANRLRRLKANRK